MGVKMTVPEIKRMRDKGERIVALTAYDYTMACLVDAGGADLVLVGDSLGTVIQGHATTLPVSLDEMIYHSRMVVRGIKRALVIADLPFMSYQLGPKEALAAAGRLLKEAGVAGVKLEGGAQLSETIAAISQAGIPVMGHVGLSPQCYHKLGGYAVQGKSPQQAAQILADAQAVEKAGAFSVVLEAIPAELALEITDKLAIPTIGIGAGVHCSGQILVLHDMLGLTHLEEDAYPKFVRRYAALAQDVVAAVSRYREDIRAGLFPGKENTYVSK
jgi:3-methyl-2-oxobutanoate hydroxymethyltransferase